MEKLFTLDGETMREFTKEEYAQYELDKIELEKQKTDAEAKLAARSALLTKLGITADEAALLLS